MPHNCGKEKKQCPRADGRRRQHLPRLGKNHPTAIAFNRRTGYHAGPEHTNAAGEMMPQIREFIKWHVAHKIHNINRVGGQRYLFQNENQWTAARIPKTSRSSAFSSRLLGNLKIFNRKQEILCWKILQHPHLKIYIVWVFTFNFLNLLFAYSNATFYITFKYIFLIKMNE